MPSQARSTALHRLGAAFARIAVAVTTIVATATCDGANVLGPVGVDPLQLEWLSDTLLLVEGRVQPVVRIVKDGAVVTGARVAYSTSNPDIVAVSSGGDSLHAKRLGTADLTIRVLGSLFPEEGESWQRSVRVVLKDLQLDRSAVNLTSVGDTATIHAIPLGADDRVIDVPVQWQSEDTNKVVVADGRLTARGTGVTTVTAVVGPDTARATVSVEQRLARFVLTPEAVTLTSLDDQVTITATAVDNTGAPVDGVTPFWESGDASIARVNESGVVTAVGVGTTSIYAFKGPVRSGALVQVRNDPATVIVVPVADTLTKPGQQLSYTAEVRNGRGVPLPEYPLSWRSDNTAVVTVSSSGTATAAGQGTARVIAQAGAVADSVAFVVRDLTTLHVDNASNATPSIGTHARPFATIQAALADATSGDTIALHPGNRPYAETLSLVGQIAIVGNDSAYRANGDNPAFLPTVSHETGAAAISVAQTSSVVLRNLAIRHATDGPAVDADGAGVRIENVHVNPGQTFRVGRGFRIANATGPVIADSRINAVVGYGILLSNVGAGTITRVQVSGVDSVAGANGEGIRIVRGAGNTVESSAVRGTEGVRILLDSTAGARVASDTVAGRHRLLRVRATTGATVITGNVFNLAQQSSDPPSAGSSADDRAALEVIGSGGVSITGNTFTEVGNAMDAIRLIDVRGQGASIASSGFAGGRYQVRSTRSTWSLTSSVLDGAVRAIVAEEADTIAMTSDTLRNGAGRGCVDVRGASSLSVVGGWLSSCTSASADTGMAAITVDGVGATLTVRGTRFSGANETAIGFTGGALTVQNATLSGAGTRTVPALRWPAAITATGGSVELTGSSITDYRGLDAASLVSSNVRVEGNRMWRQRRGLVLSQWSTAVVANNDFADHEVAALVNVEPILLSTGVNWWGDGRGPRRAAAIDAVGDSVVGSVSFGTPATTPNFAAGAGTEDSLRIVRGNNQSGPRGTTLPLRLTVRVMDAQGRPAAGVTIRFRILSGGGSVDGSGSVDRVSNASGLAEVQMTLGGSAGTTSVEAAYGTGNRRRAVVFTVTSQ